VSDRQQFSVVSSDTQEFIMFIKKLPSPSWHGSDNNLLDKYVEFLHYQRDIARSAEITELHHQIKDLETSISDAKTALARWSEDQSLNQKGDRQKIIENIHKLQRELRLNHARLVELQLLINETIDTVDVEMARQELQLITTGIPGIMGMQFRRGVPVVHFRASYVAYGERYDFGDYELVFKEIPSPPTAVVQTRITRYPMGSIERNESLPYWFDGNGGWFCFGERATEIRKQFRSCQFGHFVNLAVNSISSLNDDDHYMISRLATIPMDAVWHNHPRQRPRRRILPKIGRH
jgi:hypothetical protein